MISVHFLVSSAVYTEDEYLSGMLRIRIMSATDIKAKTGIYILLCVLYYI